MSNPDGPVIEALDAACSAYDGLSPRFSDDSLALRFADRFSPSLRYVAAWNRWLGWNGARWAHDETLHFFDLSRRCCQEASAEALASLQQPGATAVAGRVASAKVVAAVVTLGRADRRIAATVAQWDADPWLLNTPKGVVDLRTGEIRAPSAGDYMTKMTTAAPAPGGSPHPLWTTFLGDATGGDAGLERFLQRLGGYCLTGSIKEHALAFLHGPGGNGKGVFLGTLSRILGDYAVNAPMETFVHSSAERHPADLAMLRGARLVTAQETEEGRTWAEAKIKGLTGGDPITARFMRQDFFTFRPTFKLFFSGNHKPSLRSVDEAIRRRFHLVPFTAEIAEDRRDLDLPEKLEAEWPAILRWLIDGCLAWQAEGLAPPPIVLEATADYLASEDAHSQWLDERCERESQSFERTADLYDSFIAWAKAAGEPAGKLRGFVEAMRKRGLRKGRNTAGQKGFYGVRLRRPSRSDGPEWWGR